MPNNKNSGGGRGGNQKSGNNRGQSSERGFAAMDEKTQKEIARKGGESVSRDRDHMSEIGQKGGEAVSKDREHMAEIGRKGGEASGGTSIGRRRRKDAWRFRHQPTMV